MPAGSNCSFSSRWIAVQRRRRWREAGDVGGRRRRGTRSRGRRRRAQRAAPLRRRRGRPRSSAARHATRPRADSGRSSTGAVCGTDSRHRSRPARSVNQGSCWSRHGVQSAAASDWRSPPSVRQAASTAACAPRRRSTSVPTPACCSQRLAFSGSGWPPQAFSRSQRLRLRQLEAQRGFGGGARQHLQAHLDDQAQRAERAGHQPRHVVAGHVLHHLAAEREQLAAAVDQGQAEHVVAHRADAGARRPRQAGGHHAADGGARRRSAAARTAGTGPAQPASPRVPPAACRRPR